MLAKNICLALLGFSAGITAAGGLFSFIIGLGVISEFPIVKDTTPNMMNPRLYTTSYNKP